MTVSANGKNHQDYLLYCESCKTPAGNIPGPGYLFHYFTSGSVQCYGSGDETIKVELTICAISKQSKQEGEGRRYVTRSLEVKTEYTTGSQIFTTHKLRSMENNDESFAKLSPSSSLAIPTGG